MPVLISCSYADGRRRAGRKRDQDFGQSSRMPHFVLVCVCVAPTSSVYDLEIHTCALSPLWHVSDFQSNASWSNLFRFLFSLTLCLVRRLAGVASFLLGLSLFLLTVAVSWFLARPLLVFSLVGTGATLWTAYGTPDMHEAWVFPAWIGVMVLIHGSIAGWNYYIKDDPERTPLLT